MEIPPFFVVNFQDSATISSTVAILYGIGKLALRKASKLRLSRVNNTLFRFTSLIGGNSFTFVVPVFDDLSIFGLDNKFSTFQGVCFA